MQLSDVMARYVIAAVLVVLAGYLLPVLIGAHPGDGTIEWIGLTIGGALVAIGALRVYYLWWAGR